MSFLTLSNIHSRLNDSHIIKDINFTQKKFQKIAIAGETGSGKTTLLKMIAGYIQPDAGNIIFEGKKF